MINSGKVVEPTGITVVAEVAQREKDLVRWPAKDKATADNHWRHARQCCVQLCWWRYFRQESPEDRQPVIYINVCQFDRSNNSTKSLNRNAEPSHRSQVGLKQEYCAVIKKSGASSLILALSQLMIVLNNRFRPSQSVYNSQQHQRWDNDLLGWQTCYRPTL